MSTYKIKYNNMIISMVIVIGINTTIAIGIRKDIEMEKILIKM